MIQRFATTAAALMLTLMGSAGCGKPPAPAPAPNPTPVMERVARAQAEWRTVLRAKRVVEVCDGVHVALGYGLATSTMIVGPEGRVIVDTLETPEAAAEAKAAFDAISSAPVRAVIYTHGHPDHTGGTAVFAEGGVPVYAHARHADLVAEQRTPAGAAYRIRAIRQFGIALPDDAPARFLRLDPSRVPAAMPPTHPVEAERYALDVAGVSLELIHLPGESIDQVAVWWPERKVLLAGDNIYPAFPNLYTVRGEPSRSALRWGQVIDAMRTLGAEYLVSGHGAPLSDAAAVAETLTAYGDAIQYVHDQTMRGAADGKTADELAAAIRLPPHLAEHPWLQEVYGRVDWSVRSIFAGYLGFFDGDAALLHPLPPRERAQRWAGLAGGPEALRAAMEAALAAGGFQWAAELSATLLALDESDAAARAARAQALDALARQESSVNGINYYMTQAAEARGDVVLEDPVRRLGPDYIASVPLSAVFATLSTRLRAEDCLDLDETLALHFPDVQESWSIRIRRGIAEIAQGPPERSDYALTMPSMAWKTVLFGSGSPAITLLTQAEVEGNLLGLRRFLTLFSPE